MAVDRMALIRELSAHVGKPDFLQVAERIKRQLTSPGDAVHPPRPAPERAMRRPSTRRVA